MLCRGSITISPSLCDASRYPCGGPWAHSSLIATISRRKSSSAAAQCYNLAQDEDTARFADRIPETLKGRSVSIMAPTAVTPRPPSHEQLDSTLRLSRIPVFTGVGRTRPSSAPSVALCDPNYRATFASSLRMRPFSRGQAPMSSLSLPNGVPSGAGCAPPSERPQAHGGLAPWMLGLSIAR